MRRAFTLVELTLCMAIMAILAAIAMPRYARAIAAYRVRSAAHRISIDLSQAQSLARTSSTARTISFDLNSASYRIANLRDLETNAGTYSVLLGNEPYRSSISTINFGGTSQITFDGYGNPSCGGTITLQSGDTVKSVVVDSTTGKVSVR